MVTVGQLTTGAIITAAPDESVARAARRMECMHVGGLPVVDGDGHLIGIITSRDVRRAHPNRLVADAMTKQVITISPTASVWEARELLERNGVERLPVVEQDRLVGIVNKAQVAAAIGRLTDDLTGLPTASFVRFMAEKLLRDGREVCLLFLDLDDFGALNKRLGHSTGDVSLQNVSTVLRRTCDEETDFLCRYGGDEFAVVTLRPAGEAQRLACALVRAVATDPSTEGWGVALSVGVVGGHRSAVRDQELRVTVDNLINLASRASTEAKRVSTGVLLLDTAG